MVKDCYFGNIIRLEIPSCALILILKCYAAQPLIKFGKKINATRAEINQFLEIPPTLDMRHAPIMIY